MGCIQQDITDNIGTKVLFRILDDYQSNGTPYIEKEVKLLIHMAPPRRFLINLYNDSSRRDTVLIRMDKEPTDQNSG